MSNMVGLKTKWLEILPLKSFPQVSKKQSFLVRELLRVKLLGDSGLHNKHSAFFLANEHVKIATCSLTTLLTFIVGKSDILHGGVLMPWSVHMIIAETHFGLSERKAKFD